MHIQVSGFSGGLEFVVCPFWKRFKYCGDSAVTWISTLKKQGTRPSTKICFNSEASSIGSIIIGFMFPPEIVISRRFNQPTPLPKVRPPSFRWFALSHCCDARLSINPSRRGPWSSRNEASLQLQCLWQLPASTPGLEVVFWHIDGQFSRDHEKLGSKSMKNWNLSKP